MLQGAGDFYAGLLHPLLVPGEALVLVAAGLLLGTSGRTACRLGLPALAAGLVLGLVVGRVISPSLATPLLLAVALSVAAVVVTGLRLPAIPASMFATLAGAAVGIDAQPEAAVLSSRLVAGAATLLGGTALALVVVGLVLDRVHPWQRIAGRVVASWVVACAILYFAWLLVPTPG